MKRKDILDRRPRSIRRGNQVKRQANAEKVSAGGICTEERESAHTQPVQQLPPPHTRFTIKASVVRVSVGTCVSFAELSVIAVMPSVLLIIPAVERGGTRCLWGALTTWSCLRPCFNWKIIHGIKKCQNSSKSDLCCLLATDISRELHSSVPHLHFSVDGRRCSSEATQKTMETCGSCYANQYSFRQFWTLEKIRGTSYASLPTTFDNYQPRWMLVPSESLRLNDNYYRHVIDQNAMHKWSDEFACTLTTGELHWLHDLDHYWKVVVEQFLPSPNFWVFFEEDTIEQHLTDIHGVPSKLFELEIFQNFPAYLQVFHSALKNSRRTWTAVLDAAIEAHNRHQQQLQLPQQQQHQLVARSNTGRLASFLKDLLPRCTLF